MEKLKTKLKTYNNVYVGNINGQKVIVKNITPAEKEFFAVSTDSVSSKYISTPLKITGSEAQYLFIEGGDIVGKDKNTWLKAVRVIASICTIDLQSKQKHQSIPNDDVQKYLEKINNVELLANQHGGHLNAENFVFMRKILDKLDLSESFSHDDTIALNILSSNNEVKIIDWEHVKISFAENDIGRFLSDLYWENPKSDKYYYPSEWHDDLLGEYLNERLKMNPNLDSKQVLENIKFAKMWNYLGPIFSILSKGDKLESDWFLANIEAFNLLSN